MPTTRKSFSCLLCDVQLYGQLKDDEMYNDITNLEHLTLFCKYISRT